MLLRTAVYGLLLLVSINVFADNSGFTVNTDSVYQMRISVCLKKESAIEVIDAEKKSREDANKAFDKLADCDNIPISFRVGKVVHSIYARGVVSRVVEIEPVNNPEVKAYWLTTLQILPAIGPKSDAIKQMGKAQLS